MMNPWSHFSLRFLLLWMGVVAVGCAMLARPNVWCWSIASTLTLFLLATAIPLAVFLQGGRRVFWLAFAIVGWLFLFMSNGVLEKIGISANGSVFLQLTRLVPERWVFQNEYFYLVATELSVLTMATLAGLFCHWMCQKSNEQE